jgi:hypothetical protein
MRYWELEIRSDIFSIYSLVKISITWLLVFIQFFAWDYIINRTLHVGLKIWLLLFYCFHHSKIKSHIFAPPCNILYIWKAHIWSSPNKCMCKTFWHIVLFIFISFEYIKSTFSINDKNFILNNNFCDLRKKLQAWLIFEVFSALHYWSQIWNPCLASFSLN